MSRTSGNRHIVLNVLAYVVDVGDTTSLEPSSDPMPNPPAVYVESRHCPTCTGLSALEGEDHRRSLDACLKEVAKTLDGMLITAAFKIKEQADKWEA